MRVTLGPFACSGIEAFLGRDIASGVEAALRHYSERRDNDPARKALSFLDSYPELGCGAELEISLDPEVEAVLRRDARQSGGMSVSQVVSHAVLAYLADLDWASELEVEQLTQV
jgi:hypothetical protein